MYATKETVHFYSVATCATVLLAQANARVLSNVEGSLSFNSFVL